MTTASDTSSTPQGSKRGGGTDTKQKGNCRPCFCCCCWNHYLLYFGMTQKEGRVSRLCISMQWMEIGGRSERERDTRSVVVPKSKERRKKRSGRRGQKARRVTYAVPYVYLRTGRQTVVRVPLDYRYCTTDTGTNVRLHSYSLGPGPTRANTGQHGP
jgi:hypothetical protein